MDLNFPLFVKAKSLKFHCHLRDNTSIRNSFNILGKKYFFFSFYTKRDSIFRFPVLIQLSSSKNPISNLAFCFVSLITCTCTCNLSLFINIKMQYLIYKIPSNPHKAVRFLLLCQWVKV